MKLYIPTSTLNFNNLMSTESISPASFYNMRKFGIKRFNRVEPNNFDNSILLYSKVPNFVIPDDGLDNYPLIIEVDSNKIPENFHTYIVNDLTIYQCDETIYFNPIETKVYFTSENHKRICLSKSQQSIEAKLATLYSNSFEIIPNESKNIFVWNKSFLTKIKDSKANDIHKYLIKDNAIDRIKGFAYSYVIGANNSLSNELISLKKVCREIQNIVSAIITSPNGIASKSQSDRLNECVSIFTAEYEKVDENEKRINDYLKLILSKYDKLNTEELTSFLKKEDLYDFLKDRISAKQGIQIFSLDNEITKTLFSKSENRLSDFNSKINNLISRLEILYHKSKEKVDINNLYSIPFFKLTEIIDIHFPGHGTKFFISLVNEYTSEAWIGKDFSIQRLDITVAGGRLLKDFTIEFKKEWENSPEQKYINALLDSIQNYKPFDIKAHNSIVLQSFAAFILKGEDVEKLEGFLIQNNITDFRIAFALFGALNGYASLPKTFTNLLFETKDKLYLTAIYKGIYKQIHDLDIEGVIAEPRIISYTNKPDKPVSISLGSKINNSVEHKNMTKISMPTNFIAESIIVELKKEVSKVSKATEKKVSLLLKEHSGVTDLFFKDLSKSEKSKPVIEWFEKTYFKRNLTIQEKPITSSKNEINYTSFKKDLTIFNEISTDAPFYSDSNAWNFICQFVDKKFASVLKKDLVWFQKEYQLGETSKYYSKNSKENNEVIMSFERFLNKREYVQYVDVNGIISLLKTKYNNQ